MMAPLVVFDLDGTLVDTAPDLVAALNVVFANERLRPVTYAAARNLVGGGARAMIERGLDAAGRKLASAQVDRMVADFIAYYAAHIADESQPFPGLTDALEALASEGCLLAVCTNKLEALAARLLDELDLSRHFAAICGADTFGVQKPHPELLRRTIALAKGPDSAAVMVGDSATDITMARAAGVPVVAVDFGYSELPIRQFDPDRVISALNELRDAVFALAPRAPGPARLVGS